MSSSGITWTCVACGLNNRNSVACTACLSAAPKEINDKVLTECRELLEKYGQSHVLDHINDITDPSDLNKLVKQIYDIDFEYVNKLYKRAMKEEKAANDGDDEKNNITPFPHKDAFNISSIGDVDKLCDIGFKAIIAGKCGVVILAGGQGSRLGFDKPKGCYPIGGVSNKSIYQLQIEKVLAIKRVACKSQGISQIQNVKFPIYFMTSDATHDATKNFLNRNQYFKYDYADIKLFKQQLHPCLTEKDGKFIMKSANEIAMSPNGNGGIYSSLKKSGIFQDMIDRGVEYIQVFGIDNILCRIGDPLWFGHMIDSNADSSNKTCIKKEPHEKVGVMCLKGGKPAVTEYTELTKDMVELRQKKDDEKSDLEYCYGNLAMHQFSIKFMERICNDIEGTKYPLPIHIARKKIPFYDNKQSKTIKPESNNGIKLEYFVFDTYQYSEKCTVYNIERNEEFAPVKNPDGGSSPKSARIAHSNYWKQQIIKNGGKLENNDSDDKLLEVSPLFGYLPYGDKEFKKLVDGKTFRLPIYLDID